MMETDKIQGIIIDGIVYVALPKGSRHCRDCELYQRCRQDCAPRGCTYCTPIAGDSIYFKRHGAITINSIDDNEPAVTL